MSQKDTALAPARDPFALLRAMTAELDRAFDRSFGTFRWPSLRGIELSGQAWNPEIDVFERDQRLVTKIDLPGVKKEDVKVEVTDGHLAISGERKSETEATKDNVYRTERSFGSFYRVVPLPPDVKLEDVKAAFSDGVLEVSVPIPAAPKTNARQVQIEDATKAARSAA
jgi:HSP20 family protein